MPIKYEEVFINGKEFDSYNESEIIEIFSKIKDKITDVFSHDKDKDIDNEISFFREVEVMYYKNGPRYGKSEGLK